MGDRPAAGQRSLEPLTVVRIHVPQHFWISSPLSLTVRNYRSTGSNIGGRMRLCILPPMFRSRETRSMRSRGNRIKALDAFVCRTIFRIRLCRLDIVHLLQVQPELRCDIEIAPQAESGIYGYGALAIQYLLDASLLDTDGFCQAISRDPKRSQK